MTFITDPGEYRARIETAAKQIQALQLRRRFNVWAWINNQLGSLGHPGAVAESLEGALLQKNVIGKTYLESAASPYGYLTNIMKTINPEWTQKFAEKEHEKDKIGFDDLVKRLKAVHL